MKIVQRLKFWDHVFSWDDPGARPVTRQVLVFTAYAALVSSSTSTRTATTRTGATGAWPSPPTRWPGPRSAPLLVLRTNAGLRTMVGGPQALGRDHQPVAEPGDPDARQRPGRPPVAPRGRGLDRVVRPRDPPQPPGRAGHDRDGRRWSGRRRPRGSLRAEHMPGPSRCGSPASSARPATATASTGFAYLQAEEQRCLLIDHLGGCERILKTPLAAAYVVLIRRFIVLFLVMLPFGPDAEGRLVDAPVHAPGRLSDPGPRPDRRRPPASVLDPAASTTCRSTTSRRTSSGTCWPSSTSPRDERGTGPSLDGDRPRAARWLRCPLPRDDRSPIPERISA